MKNIVVVGGGTSGWLTALYAKKIFPEKNISLIESNQIGILGAGEASVPLLIAMFDFLSIPTSEIIKNTGATIKNSAKFSNWSTEENYFYHPFKYFDDSISEQPENILKNIFSETETNKNHIIAKMKNEKMSEYCFINKVCDQNKTLFVKNKEESSINPMLSFNQLGFWSLNFDAGKLAEYLSRIAILRGIKHYEGTVKKIVSDDNQYITGIYIDSDTLIEADFVFDCTGFKRLIIGDFYKSKWIDYSKYLTTNKAMPFFLEKESSPPPYIESIAMNYGWMWKTPLQHRYGCGYVFDSNMISEEDAKNEVEKFLGYEINVPKIFSFSPGCFEETWKNNCVAVGVSAGFVEPLEATSIMQTIISLMRIFSNKENFLFQNDFTRKTFNVLYEKESSEILDFIYMHFFTNKTNTEFWTNFVTKEEKPDFIEYVLETIKTRPLNQEMDFSSNGRTMFRMENYLYLIFGHNILSEETLNKYFKIINKEDIFLYEEMKNNQDLAAKKCFDHKKFLQEMFF